MQNPDFSVNQLNCGHCVIEAFPDNTHRIISADNAFVNITGYTEAMLTNSSFSYSSLVTDIEHDSLNTFFSNKITEDGSFVIEHHLKTSFNDIKRILCFGIVKDSERSVIELSLVVCPEINAESVQGSAPLLLNYRTAESAIDQFLKNEPVTSDHTLMIVDMNNYIKLTDKLGTVFMNTAMDNVTSSLLKFLTGTDIIIARTSADIFVILFKNTTAEAAASFASNINSIFLGTYTGAESKKFNTGCTIGISSYCKAARTYKELLHRADVSLFYAKRKQRLYMIYSEDIENYYPDYVKSEFFDYSRSHHNYDTSFVSFAINLLAHSREIDSSINLLIDKIGSSYNIDDVLICEALPNGNYMLQTNFWSVEEGIKTEGFTTEQYTDWDGFRSGFDIDGFMCIPNTELDMFSESDRKFFREHRISSAINCLLYDGIQMIGYASFCCRNPRNWTTFEQDTLYELSKLISTFVIMRRDKLHSSSESQYAAKDDVTGLMSYNQFLEAAQTEIFSNMDNEHTYVLAYSDINNFAYINENFGYYAGNVVLSSFAEKIKSLPVKFACRVHADRFLALLKFDKNVDFLCAFEHINADFNKQLSSMYPMGNLRVSTGLYCPEATAGSIDDAVENANIARKTAKEKNNCTSILFNYSLKSQRERERSIIAGVHSAIAEGRICVYLQPKYSLKSQKVIGAEALTRWINPDGSMVFPDIFIPPLERIGYIVDLDFFIFEQTLKFMARWKNLGKELVPISFNFSRVHTIHSNFVERVTELPEKYGIDKSLVEIEITESCLASDQSLMLDAVKELRKAGFKIDVDDFGTGYSSLNMLMDIPVDIVKIDRSFMKNTDTDSGRNYIRQIGALICAAGKDIIFEGVETDEQAAFLLGCGYENIQGYLFSRPIPIGEFEKKYVLN